MKKWKACLALVLALVLSLSLAACAGNDANTDGDDQDNDIAGSDWRTTGIVRDSGTITRDGEDTTVLVCINTLWLCNVPGQHRRALGLLSGDRLL